MSLAHDSKQLRHGSCTRIALLPAPLLMHCPLTPLAIAAARLRLCKHFLLGNEAQPSPRQSRHVRPPRAPAGGATSTGWGIEPGCAPAQHG